MGMSRRKRLSSSIRPLEKQKDNAEQHKFATTSLHTNTNCKESEADLNRLPSGQTDSQPVETAQESLSTRVDKGSSSGTPSTARLVRQQKKVEKNNLPKGWHRGKEQSGRTFYLNFKTGKKQYERPAPPVKSGLGF